MFIKSNILIEFVSVEFIGLPSTLLAFFLILFHLRTVTFLIYGRLVCHMVWLCQVLSQGRPLLWTCRLSCLQQEMQHRQTPHPPVLHRC